ncbi:translin-associated factor X-interacting protein 1 [Bombina bombina]|uniref:translin-associated factor X-interacting protein 1 n=1 Tax=Bombina bombina TaxID=8345 RepID=UPI00235A9D67|nr:translin-associated factor X-interacting protein 1 [Bombina bombina]
MTWTFQVLYPNKFSWVWGNPTDSLHHKSSTILSDCWTGHVSTWPAYGAGHNILQKRKPCSAPDIKYYRSAEQSAKVVSKPRYLEQLETYLKRELQSLNLTGVKAQELRLQPFREVFEYFIEDFKTYKPLLSAIKNEYEVTLAHQREQIRELEPLKALLVTVSEHCDQKIQAMHEEERLEIKTLKHEKLSLMKMIEKMNEDKYSLQAQVSKLQEELAEAYLQYRNECDARKLLISDINELRYQQEDMKSSHIHDKHGDDPVTLAIALKVARKDLAQTQIELNTMKADYGNVVPRRDFENQEKKLSELLQKIDVLQKDMCQLHKEHKSLLEINQQVLAQRDAACAELEELQLNSTPRPAWEKCTDVLPGVFERLLSQPERKSSDQLVNILLTEMGTRLLKDKEFFIGMGKGDTLPAHLQHEGPIKNVKLSAKEVSVLLRDVWKEKIASDEQRGKQSSLPEFFIDYLQKRFGDAAVEWSYSVHESCRVYITNESMHLFYKILMGQVDEDQYHALTNIQSSLLNELVSADSGNDGLLTQKQFSAQLRNTFPLKSMDEIQDLLDIADSQLLTEGNNIPYKSLFTEDEEGRPGPFIAALWNQFAAEKKQYLKQLKNKLGNRDIKPEDLRMSFLAVDPTIDSQTLDRYISRGFLAPTDQFEQIGSMAIKQVFQNLEAGNIYRMGPATSV